MHIARHDKAMRKVIHKVIRGQYGNYHTVADVGRLDRLKEMGVHSKEYQPLFYPMNTLPTADLTMTKNATPEA